MLVEPVLGDLDFTGGDRVIAFVNGMGGTPLLELYVMYAEVRRCWTRPGVTVARSLVGNYMTSLEMAGCSVTLLRSTTSCSGCGTPRCAPPACAGGSEPWRTRSTTAAPARGLGRASSPALITEHERAELTELDSAIGDADHGTNMDRGMSAAVAALEAAPPGDPGALLKQVGMTLVSKVGGASGPLYGTLLPADGRRPGPGSRADAETFARALRAGLDGVVARGKAEPGDKTMLDALLPACDALDARARGREPLGRGAHGRGRGGRETGRTRPIPLVARKGRASYLGERSAGHQDPGATSTALLLDAAAATLAGS